MSRTNRPNHSRRRGYDLVPAYASSGSPYGGADAGRPEFRGVMYAESTEEPKITRSRTASAEQILARQEAEFEEMAAQADTSAPGKRTRLSEAEKEHTRKAEAKVRAAQDDTLAEGESPRGKHSIVNNDASQYSRERAGRRYSARKTGMGTGKKVGLAIAAVLVIALVCGGIAVATWYSRVAGNLQGDGKITNLAEATAGEPYYVLLMGGDSRADSKEDNRTDSLMVARVDEKNKKVSLLSIPRDLRVYIDGHGYCKINSAIEYGGYNETVGVVNKVLGIQVNYYAFIYFSGFKDLVDKLGGVTVDVPAGTYYHGTWVPAGEDVEINGKEALVLARCRHGYPPDTGAYAMGDYQRTLNQRNLIKAIAKKVLAKDKTELPGLVTSVSKCIETNLGVDKIIDLATKMKGMDVNSIHADSLPYAGSSIDDAYYAILYQDVFTEVMANYTSGKDPYEGLGKFDSEMNGNDIGSDYTDGEVYSYTTYKHLYGDYHGKKKSKS